MSKKTRKKSPKTSPGKAARAAKTSAGKPAAKAGKAGANKSAKPAAKKAGAKNRKQPAKATAKASHKAPSKKLKSAVPRQSAPRAASESKASAAISRTGNPPRQITPLAKTESTAASRTTISKPSTATTSKPPTPAAKIPAAKSTAAKSELAAGAKAPGFRLPRDGGDTVALADYAGRKLVLFFYPRADTPGCTREAIDFTRLSPAFAEGRTAVLGVSADPVKAQEAFRDKHELAVPLMSDETHEMLEAYGVWGEKSMYGKTFLGIVRTTVLIGADGRVIRIWRNVRVDGHAEEVLEVARAS